MELWATPVSSTRGARQPSSGPARWFLPGISLMCWSAIAEAYPLGTEAEPLVQWRLEHGEEGPASGAAEGRLPARGVVCLRAGVRRPGDRRPGPDGQGPAG